MDATKSRSRFIRQNLAAGTAAIHTKLDMNQEYGCVSAEEARATLAHFKSKNNDAYFRGEARLYPSTMPALLRLGVPEAVALLFATIPNLVGHMWQQRLSRFLTNSCGILTFKDEPFGAADLVDRGSDTEPHNVDWGFYGLIQHYGIPTNWLDMSRDPDVAIYFASTPNGEEFGAVFYGSIGDFRGSGVVIDVADFARQLRQIVPIETSRPERQSALALRLCGEKDFRSHAKCVRFRKDVYSRRFDDDYFPPDALKAWVLGQVVDYWLDFRTRAHLVESLADPEVQEHDDRIRTVIRHLNLW